MRRVALRASSAVDLPTLKQRARWLAGYSEDPCTRQLPDAALNYSEAATPI
jgi:hypothetical protein